MGNQGHSLTREDVSNGGRKNRKEKLPKKKTFFGKMLLKMLSCLHVSHQINTFLKKIISGILQLNPN